MGAIVCPPSPGFYTRPATLEELIDHTVSRLLDVTGVKLSKSLSERWTGPEERRRGRNGTGRAAARGEAAAETESGVGAEPEGAAESR
jgi:hypothetical protein